MKAADIGPLRLIAHHLAGPPAATPTSAVTALTALQGQDLPGALTSIALRTSTPTAVTAAFDNAQLVRTWPMRGTLHVIAATDLRWLLDLLAPRMRTAAARRRTNLGLDNTTIHRAETIAATLTNSGPTSRDNLYAAWTNAGIDTSDQRGYHLLWHAALAAAVCFGPLVAGRNEQLIVGVDQWMGSTPGRDREESLADLAGRYFTSHGPATERDFARWAGITLGDARAGIAATGQPLTTARCDGATYLMAADLPDRLAAHRADARQLRLLPGFDEYLLGYADRLVPGGNGMFRASIISDGTVIGVWRKTAGGGIHTEPFTALTAAQHASITNRYDTIRQLTATR